MADNGDSGEPSGAGQPPASVASTTRSCRCRPLPTPPWRLSRRSSPTSPTPRRVTSGLSTRAAYILKDDQTLESYEPQRFSKDGYEEHMQVNHLAPSLLSMLLLPSLLRGSPSRIINVNSIMHFSGFVDTDDMNMTSGRKRYSSYLGYTGSKLAQVKFSSILQKRLPAEAGINVICVSPGMVQTNVARDLPKVIIAAYHLIPYFLFNAREGSRSSLFAATDPQVPEYCGVLKADEWPVCPYISFDCHPMNASEEAHNLETSREVWEKSLNMIGLPPDALEKLIEGEEIECRYGSTERN